MYTYEHKLLQLKLKPQKALDAYFIQSNITVKSITEVWKYRKCKKY